MSKDVQCFATENIVRRRLRMAWVVCFLLLVLGADEQARADVLQVSPEEGATKPQRGRASRGTFGVRSASATRFSPTRSRPLFRCLRHPYHVPYIWGVMACIPFALYIHDRARHPRSRLARPRMVTEQQKHTFLSTDGTRGGRYRLNLQAYQCHASLPAGTCREPHS